MAGDALYFKEEFAPGVGEVVAPADYGERLAWESGEEQIVVGDVGGDDLGDVASGGYAEVVLVGFAGVGAMSDANTTWWPSWAAAI